MRRIAHLVADLLACHGYEATANAALTGRSRTTYTLPLAARRDGHLVLLDGDLSGRPVDDADVHRLVMAATDLGCKTALYLHAGPLTAAALDATQGRVHFWGKEALVPLLGATQWAHALGEPMPPLPAPLGSAPAAPRPADAAPAPEPAPAVQELVAPAPVFRPEEMAPPQRITLAENESFRNEEFLDLGGSDLADHHADDPVQTELPAAAPEPLEVAEIVPAAPTPEPVPEPVLAKPEPAFVPPAAVDLMPPAFQDAKPETVAAPAPVVASPAKPPEAPLFTLPPAFRPDAPAPMPENAAPLVAPDGSRGLLPPRLTLDEAKARVADRLFAIEEAELILQPVHLFDYAVELLGKGSLNVNVVSGRLQVNGTDRRVMPTEAAACDPNLPHRVFATPELTIMDKVCRVSPERAKQVASEWATAQHAKTVEVNGAGADDSFDLLEKRQVGPTSGQVSLTYLGLWHRPFWRLWGSNGHADIDAVEATVLDEEIKGPSPDFMLVE